MEQLIARRPTASRGGHRRHSFTAGRRRDRTLRRPVAEGTRSARSGTRPRAAFRRRRTTIHGRPTRSRRRYSTAGHPTGRGDRLGVHASSPSRCMTTAYWCVLAAPGCVWSPCRSRSRRRAASTTATRALAREAAGIPRAGERRAGEQLRAFPSSRRPVIVAHLTQARRPDRHAGRDVRPGALPRSSSSTSRTGTGSVDRVDHRGRRDDHDLRLGSLTWRGPIHGPLHGVRVLELGTLIAAPFASRLFAESAPSDQGRGSEDRRSDHAAGATCTTDLALVVRAVAEQEVDRVEI